MKLLFLGASLGAVVDARAQQTASVDALEATRTEWLRQVEAARERYDAFAARVVADHAVTTRDDARLDDPTLRRGDIVVTATGLLVFKGSSKLVSDLSDFERVGEESARSLPHRSALLDILRAHALGGR